MRQKAYYTRNEIIPDLYTIGKEYMLSDNTEYIGKYHKYITTGEIYTLSEWSDRFSKPLKVYKELDPKIVTYKNFDMTHAVKCNASKMPEYSILHEKYTIR